MFLRFLSGLHSLLSEPLPRATFLADQLGQPFRKIDEAVKSTIGINEKP
ncbi:MAG: hypothetical protein K8R46_13525 [Pirellulales bacterium]|nr:hypothetical protein [Pirellulales bacterium]